jgi:hypothetical protein
MNIYDTKPIRCVNCGKSIGEIEYDAEVISPKCGRCANPLPDGFDELSYSAHRIKSTSAVKLVPA